MDKGRVLMFAGLALIVVGSALFTVGRLNCANCEESPEATAEAVANASAEVEGEVPDGGD